MFRYKQPFEDGLKPVQYGLVAEVYPDLVAHSANGQIETVKYQVLDTMLLNGLQKIQTQTELIRALEAQLAGARGATLNFQASPPHTIE